MEGQAEPEIERVMKDGVLEICPSDITLSRDIPLRQFLEHSSLSVHPCGWTDGWMGGWVDGWMNGWMDGYITGWMDGWMNEWMNE